MITTTEFLVCIKESQIIQSWPNRYSLFTGSRLSATEYLECFTDTVFPDYFKDALHPFFGSVLSSSPDARVLQLKSQFQVLKTKVMGTGPNGVVTKVSSEAAQMQSDGKDGLDSIGRYVVATSSPSSGPSAYMTGMY